MRRKNVWAAAGGFWLWFSGTAYAGMPTFMLSDLARLRIDNISFFLLIVLAASFGLKLVWNYLQKDFKNLPRLGYKKAVGFVVLWGLAFYLVLAMIAGTREIMTPKAWQKQGVTYQLKDYQNVKAPEDDSIPGLLAAQRKNNLNSLKRILWKYAAANNGSLPANDQVPDIPPAAWQINIHTTQRFIYLPGQKINIGDYPIAYEPAIFGANRYVLFSSGEIKTMEQDILKLLTQYGNQTAESQPRKS